MKDIKRKFYITSAIPYVNAKPHIGHALEFVQTNAIKRYYDLLGFETTSLCGGDENALKNVQAAEVAGQPVQEFVDENSDWFLKLTQQLNAEYDVWQKGSNTETHHLASQKLWELCDKNGDIYKKEYTGLYCVGCETFYEKDELDDNGECHEHPGKKLEEVSESNYFFKLSKYEKELKELISSDKLEILPESRKNEMLSFIDQGLQDISISRSNERAKNWGVPVPGDDSQRMYVWFDALNIYQSGIGFGWDKDRYEALWPADVQVIGKGITRFHAIYWPAFLMSAGLELPKRLFVHGYFTVDGQKMSKTIGNVVDPFEMVEKYGVDPLRYYLLREIPAYSDGDFSERRFAEVYNADLANGLGNLIARTAKLAESRRTDPRKNAPELPEWYTQAQHEFRFEVALEKIWEEIRDMDKYLNEHEPWKEKDEDKRWEIMKPVVERLLLVGHLLRPFLPETAEKMLQQFGDGDITVQEPYFKRL